MSIQNLLQQLLQSGQSLAQDAGAKINNSSAASSGSNFGGFGGGALAGGALGLLLGNKKFRKMGGKFATYGGTAALGALALKAYQDWQSKGGTTGQGRPAVTPVVVDKPMPMPAVTAALTPTGSLEHDSKIVLAAMIAAAKADGHIGNDEKQLIDNEITKLTNDPSDLAWFEAELAKPADPAQAAALASSPEQAAEVYLASVLVIDEESFMERAYLDELARQLNLAPGLKNELEAKVKSLG